ncbi:hypothetical protein Mal64_32150 [Pseudobythopirellula maris]|uniref:DUF4345 domain-containing protein n=1 Tax=Pseudobythopirellula maris TaxID=2527991 RepID=A0A5C5ZMK6_9BACT|nr:hypothetical protein [Pseudobythopirellula maris]TWT87673.1 hypothetical protein Mal64_32150 [Pseudobythopirellula maris]
MLAARIFLYVVAALYIALGIWCAASPGPTSEKVGLERVGAGGKSEFFTVYGGLEVGIGLALVILAWSDATVVYGVLTALVIHGSLVAFRSISFSLYDAMQGFTLRLAIGEWVIFLISGVLYWMIRKQ